MNIECLLAAGDAEGEWFDFAHHPELVEGSSIFFKKNYLKKIESRRRQDPRP